MKKALTLCMILFASITVHAQDECSDIIYLGDGENMIFKVCIDEIRNGNMVYYTKAGKLDSVSATAVNVDGQHIDLSQFEKQNIHDTIKVSDAEIVPETRDYDYYNDQYNKASKQKTIGTYLTFSGAFMSITGYILLSNNTSEEYKQPLGGVLFVIGTVALNVGIPLWISGSVKRANNARAMESVKSVGLSLETSTNGVGLVLRF
jgi:hypothetical protein